MSFLGWHVASAVKTDGRITCVSSGSFYPRSQTSASLRPGSITPAEDRSPGCPGGRRVRSARPRRSLRTRASVRTGRSPREARERTRANRLGPGAAPISKQSLRLLFSSSIVSGSFPVVCIEKTMAAYRSKQRRVPFGAILTAQPCPSGESGAGRGPTFTFTCERATCSSNSNRKLSLKNWWEK